MSHDFTTRLQRQLREAALREERRGALGRRLAGLRYATPSPAAAAAVALTALLVAVVMAAGGIRWRGDERVSNPKVIGNVPLADNLGTLAPGFGSVWVADAKRRVVLRVDPRTRAVQAEIATGGDPNAVGGDPLVNTGAGAVWAVVRRPGSDGGNRVLRIDPGTNRITARATLPTAQAPLVFGLQMIDGHPWVITARGAIELDAVTAAPGRFVRIDQPSSEPYPLWSTGGPGGELWVLTREARIDRYDLLHGSRKASLPVRLAGTVAVIPTPDGPVYVTTGGELARAHTEDGRVAWRHRLGTLIGAPLVVGETLWVHASDMAGGRDRLVEVALRSGRILSSTGLPEFGVAGMADVGGDVWLSTPAGNVMVVRP